MSTEVEQREDVGGPAAVGLVVASLAVAVGALGRGGGEGAWPWLLLNLILAWAPVVFGRLANLQGWPWLLPWLLFLPNAPYLVTDLIHLRPKAVVPLWYDATLLGGAAALGLALGVRATAEAWPALVGLLGQPGARLLSLLLAPLTGVALWIGRHLRWNSWDALLRPLEVLADLAPLLTRPADHAGDWAYIACHAALFAAALLCAPPRTPRSLTNSARDLGNSWFSLAKAPGVR